MTKKQIIKWWEGKTSKRLVEIQTKDTEMIRGIREACVKDLGIDKLAAEIHQHMLAANDAITRAKKNLTGNDDVTIKGYAYNSFSCRVASWASSL